MIRLALTLGLMAAPAVAQTLYRSEGTARVRCGSDTVVWLNTESGVYHFAGERWYGHTKAGAYVCEKQADAAGDRATKNGQ